MHESVMQWCAGWIEKIGNPTRVLDIGSLDVNGSTRSLVTPIFDYVGIDIRDGNGVDIVMPAADIVTSIPANHFDLVFCTEMLEHDPTPWLTLAGVAHVLSPGGHLLLTARGVATDRCPGAGRPHAFGEHGEPFDFWRFMPQTFQMLFELVGLDVLEVSEDPQAPGWFGAARKP